MPLNRLRCYRLKGRKQQGRRLGDFVEDGVRENARPHSSKAISNSLAGLTLTQLAFYSLHRNTQYNNSYFRRENIPGIGEVI